ncbi:MarR family transcriptional regulator [Hyphobacterium sp. HN65]|uniref:MarR family transcriptional regulator n=1 Tax=Hyphobacterium lacteum TaxID=3116575 RepID=A0ABU7LRI5_9PROT|nr:MarR family transcriptional regulator [Hyphobacterium sp. HN65]MEE2526246.1 MarR family transcriptional regulator [Hyphobacterium sp. HN65]
MPRDATLRLEAYLPYRLSVASNRASRWVARSYEAKFGLSIWQWRVIAVLGGAERLTAQDLATATAMDKVTVSRAVNALIERGLVARKKHESDGRSAFLELTGPGRSVYEEVAPVALQHEADLLDGFSAEEIDQLTALLERIEKRAEDLAGD